MAVPLKRTVLHGVIAAYTRYRACDDNLNTLARARATQAYGPTNEALEAAVRDWIAAHDALEEALVKSGLLKEE